MAFRRARVLLGAFGLTVAMGVGLVGPASAASITPIKPLVPVKSSAPIKPPAPAPVGPRIPFKGWSPKKIKDTSVRTATGASSVRVKGSGVGQNEKLSWDGLFTKSTAKLRLTSTKQGTVNLIRIGNRIFLAGDAKFWIASGAKPGDAKLLTGQWVEILGNSASVRQLRTQLTISAWTSALGSFKVTKRVVGKRIGGKATVGLYEPGSQGGVLYVAASGKAYPMGAETADKTVVITYTEWNKRYHITAPVVLTRVTI